MFDNLRDQLSSAPLSDDAAKLQSEAGTSSTPPGGSARHFLGMTPQQRFFVTVIMMIMVCILGTLCLLVTGRISLF
jgi:hypothetical protein